jgi:hypothetical protein
MLKFYEYFDAGSNENTTKPIQEANVVEDPQTREKGSNLGSNSTMNGEPLLLPASAQDKEDIQEQ